MSSAVMDRPASPGPGNRYRCYCGLYEISFDVENNPTGKIFTRPLKCKNQDLYQLFVGRQYNDKRECGIGGWNHYLNRNPIIGVK